MREMKDSGLGYLGKIPYDWNIERIKNHLRFSPDKNPGDAVILSLYREHGIVPKDSRDDNHNVTSEDTSNYRYVRVGDFVVNKMKAWQGSMGVSAYEGVVSPAYYVYRFTTDAFDKKYLHYLLRSKCYADEFRRLSGGIRIGQWDLPKVGFETTYVAIPPKNEQTAIAETIDAQLKKVDALITNVQTQIEKLKAYKQSLITEVVTKGLDLTVPMKDSGFDWIGSIPEHWEKLRVKYIGDTQNGISKGGEYFGSGYPFVSYSDVYKNMELPHSVAGLVESTDAERENYSVKKGDIFFTRTSETIEEVGFSSVCTETIEDATFAGFLIRLRPFNDAITTQYAKYYFRGEHIRRYLVKEMNLVTRASLGQGLLKAMTVLIPPKDEQIAIAEHLDGKCNQIDRLIAIKQAKIEKLEQYKRSLIYEYVTGKKEVV